MSDSKDRGPRRHAPRRRRPPEKLGPKRESIQELHPIADPPQVDSFEEWALGEEIQRAIRAMDISVPTPIQALSIGAVLEGKDVIAKAETGTGKTLAFGAPMMARVDPARATVLGLVLCPTRELAQQVANVLSALALPRGVKVALVVGGDPMHPQIAALQSGAQVVVGTPGRVLDLYQQRFLSFPWTEFVVLDEADKMFEIGFLDDIKRILSYVPEERQTLLFSATFPTEVLKLARASTREPVEVATAKGTATVETITQYRVELDDEDRPLRLIRLLERSGPRDVFLVFCERRTEVDRLMRRLDRLPISIKALHGGYDQASRFRVMSAFRTGEVKALVATDVASRGLDVEHVTHVVNYSVPRDLEDYTHRIGRTGRAGRSGIAITFVTPAQRRRWRTLTERMKWPVEELADGTRPGARPRAARPEAAAAPAGAGGGAGEPAEERGREELGRRRTRRAEPQSERARGPREPREASEPRRVEEAEPREERPERSSRGRSRASERAPGGRSASPARSAQPERPERPERDERRRAPPGRPGGGPRGRGAARGAPGGLGRLHAPPPRQPLRGRPRGTRAAARPRSARGARVAHRVEAGRALAPRARAAARAPQARGHRLRRRDLRSVARSPSGAGAASPQRSPWSATSRV